MTGKPCLFLIVLLLVSLSLTGWAKPIEDPDDALQNFDVGDQASGTATASPAAQPPAAGTPPATGQVTRKLIAWRFNCLDANGKRVTKDVAGNIPYNGMGDLEAGGFKILNSNPIFEYYGADGKLLLRDDTGAATPPTGYIPKGSPPSSAQPIPPAPTTPNPANPPAPTPPGPDGTVSLDVPQLCQYKNAPPLAADVARMSCGPTSLAMVMQFSGKNVTPNELVGPTKCTANGSWCEGLTSAAKQYGFGKARWTGSTSLSWLKDQLKAGKPVLVLTGEYGGHFMVVKGFDTKGNIIANDPADTTRKVHRLYPVDTFTSMWQNSFVLE